MFLGEYEHTLDDKGRMTVPAKFRSLLGEKIFIARFLDECLYIFPEKEWAIHSEKLSSLSLTNIDAREFSRFVFSGAEECFLDKAGRIILPSNLRQFAGIDKEVIIIGRGKIIEVWDKNKWKSKLEKMTEIYKKYSKELKLDI